MEPYYGKKYKMKATKNLDLDSYLKHIDIGFLSRKAAMAVSPVSILEKNPDGSYTYTMTTSIKTIKTTFRLGEEYDEERPDGEIVVSVMTIEGNKLIQTQTERKNGRKSTHIREFTPEVMTVTTTCDGWDGKCVRVYHLVKS